LGALPKGFTNSTGPPARRWQETLRRIGEFYRIEAERAAVAAEA